MKTVQAFLQKKQAQQKITMVTCYDYTSAKIVDKTNVDCVLVGDSGAMMMLGCQDTTQATMDDMIMMTRAVARGMSHKFIIGDLPFMSYRRSLTETVDAATQLIQAGAQAVKLEGVSGNLAAIKHLVESGVPVMGHIGLTPQHIHAFGGFKVQGKSVDAGLVLQEQAKQLADAGCFAIVVEGVPWQLAKIITEQSCVPIIGIGAGLETDGQVLVFHDLLGLQTDFKPKFVKNYLNGESLFVSSINDFVNDVQSCQFPQREHCYEGEVHEVH